VGWRRRSRSWRCLEGSRRTRTAARSRSLHGSYCTTPVMRMARLREAGGARKKEEAEESARTKARSAQRGSCSMQRWRPVVRRSPSLQFQSQVKAAWSSLERPRQAARGGRQQNDRCRAKSTVVAAVTTEAAADTAVAANTHGTATAEVREAVPAAHVSARMRDRTPGRPRRQQMQRVRERSQWAC
jgi:hypothetical protein